MSRTFIGDLCAHIKPTSPTEKSKYVRIGSAFKDEQDRVTIKLDTLPIPSLNWEGWANVMERKPYEPKAPPLPESDIPF